MRVFDRILSNALVLLGFRALQKIGSFLLLWFLIRFLAPEDFGRYSFVLTWIGMISILTDCGTSSWGIRLWAAEPARAAANLQRLFALRLLISMGGAALSIAVWRILYADLPPMLLFFIVAGTLLQFHAVGWIPFQARLEMFRPSLQALLNRLLVIGAIIGALLLAAPLPWILGLEIFLPIIFHVSLILGALRLAAQTRPTAPTPGSAPVAIGRMLRECLPFGTAAFLGMLYARIDVFMIVRLLDEAALGRYAAGYRLIEPLLTLPGAIAAGLLPIVVGRWQAREYAQVERSLDRAARLLPFGMTLVAFNLFLLAEPIVLILFGADYRESARIMRWLAWIMPFAAWAYVWSALIWAQNRLVLVNAVALLALVINVGGNLWAIPRHGIAGAAAFTLLTEIFWSMALSLAISRSRETLRLLRTHLLMGAVAAALGWLALSSGSAAIQALAGIGVSVGLLLSAWRARLVNRDDWDGVRIFIAARR